MPKLFLFCLVLALLVTGCASNSSLNTTGGSRSDSGRSADMIQVEGSITVRGNVPFNAVVLETEDNNSYILTMDDSTRAALTTPAWATVSGHLYLGTWNDVSWAHIEVTELDQRK